MTLALEAQRKEAEDTLTLLAAANAARAELERQFGELNAEELEAQLQAALAAQAEAQEDAASQRSLVEQRDALLAVARETLSAEQAVSEKAQREAALLNQQIAALRGQLGSLQALLDDYEDRNAAAEIQIQSLGQDLNAALARAASEERRRRLLEEAERQRLEAEAEALAGQNEELAAQAEDLQRYRSEFFGRLRDVLGDQDGVRIEGDRFVFSSEVLFATGSAVLSLEGRQEVAKVAEILRTVAAEIPEGLNWVIRVDGHTDNVPLAGSGRYRDNWELSQGRALSVVRYMVEALGIPPNRLAANGFGEFQPVNPEDTPEARAQNRRIELKLTER
jgi:chemotaxis protein MotB